MRLIQKQQIFAILIARLINDLNDNGYNVTFGEAYRPQETAELYAKSGRGIVNSLHGLRLAMDLNLFKNGRYLTEPSDYDLAGKIWKTYSDDEITCSWGGDFNDFNHFSIKHNGVK